MSLSKDDVRILLMTNLHWYEIQRLSLIWSGYLIVANVSICKASLYEFDSHYNFILII